MSTLSVPNSFSASTTILSAAMNSNFSAITSWAAGNIQQDNFGTMSGAITWTIASNVLALSGSTSSTTGLISYSSTGVLAADNSLLKLTTSVAQTTAAGLVDLRATHASSTKPILILTNAGSGKFIEAAATYGGSSLFSVSSAGALLASSNAPLGLLSTGDNVLGQITNSNDSGSVSLRPNLAAVNDTNGGAIISAYASNGTGSGNPANDGSMQYRAYGQGSGTYANAHTFFTRSGAGATTERARINSSGIQIGSGVLLSNSSGALVTDGGAYFPTGTGRAALEGTTTVRAENGRTLGVRTTGTSTAFPIVVSAIPSTHGLMFVRGFSDSAATLLYGEGVSVVRNSIGDYTLTVTTAFTDTCGVATFTPNTSGMTWHIASSTLSTVQVQFRSGGVLTDTGFAFIVVGQRGA